MLQMIAQLAEKKKKACFALSQDPKGFLLREEL